MVTTCLASRMANADGRTGLNRLAQMVQTLKKTMVLALILFACSAAQGASIAKDQIVLELNPAQTEINFTLPDVLHTVHGTFQLRGGTVRFDPATGAASGAVTVDVASGASGSPARDRKMHKEILESGRYPGGGLHTRARRGRTLLTGGSGGAAGARNCSRSTEASTRWFFKLVWRPREISSSSTCMPCCPTCNGA